MYIIGITGGVGAGKSEILKYLKTHYDAFAIKADDVGHILMQEDKTTCEAIIKLLGQDVLDDNKVLDRQKIAQKVYADKALLDKLSAIIHPAVKAYIKLKIDEQSAMNRKCFLIEAALLLEDNYDQICNEIWYIDASKEVRLKRLKESRAYSDEKVGQIMSNQLSAAEFKARCDLTLNNNDGFGETIKQIELRMQKYENV